MRTIPELKEGTHRAKATGALPNGKPVIVNADGTVSVVDSTSGVGVSFGSSAQISSNVSRSRGALAYDTSAEKVVVVYGDGNNGNYGTAVVGTVNGNSITFGTGVVFRSGDVELAACAYDPDTDQVIVFYADADDSSKGKAVVGSVSGTTISFGSAVQFSGDEVSRVMEAVYDTDNNKVFVLYGTSGPGVTSNTDGNVGTVSSGSISFGSVQRLTTNKEDSAYMEYDPNSAQVLISMRRGVQSDIVAVTGVISGTGITYGTPVVVNANYPSPQYGMAYDATAQRLLIGYRENTSGYLFVNVLEVSGTSFVVGAPNTIVSSSVSDVGMAYDPTNGSVTTLYQDIGDSQFGKGVAGTVSGTTYSVSAPVTFESARMDRPVLIADTAQQRLVAVYDGNGETTLESVVIQTAGPNLTSENYIGMSQGGSVASGSSGTVDIIGSLSTNQSGLTAGQSYYVQTDGTIGETAANPSVFAGTAISATSLVVKT